jgi:hypothetical protein
MFSLHVAHHPTNGEPYLFTFDKQEAWDSLYQESSTMCLPENIFDYTHANLITYTTWDDMKMVMGEYLSPEQNEELYTNRRVFI